MGWVEHNFGHGSIGYLKDVSASPELGRTASPNYLGIVDEVAAASPDIVVVAGGLNDMGTFAREPGPVVGAIIDTFHALRSRLPNARIVAIGPCVPYDITPTVVALDLDVHDAALEVGAEYVSLIAPTPAIQPYMVLPDHEHVDDSGHAAIADRIISVLAPGE
jgi:lysophospholipase L1-like esterase